MPRPLPATVARRLRGRYALAALVLLALWGASLMPLFHGAERLHIVAAIFATLTALPLGIVALFGAVSGGEAAMRRARVALLAAGGLLMLIVAAEVARRLIFAAGNPAG